MTTSFPKYKTTFKVFSPIDYTLDPRTIQHQQFQDPVLQIVYSWLIQNRKPEFPTPLKTGTPFIHAYYEILYHLLKNDSTNLIRIYTKNKISSETHPNTDPSTIHSFFEVFLPFRVLNGFWQTT